MFNEDNICGIDYDLFHVYEEKNGRIYFPEWLLPAFEDHISNDNDILQEEDACEGQNKGKRMLSISVFDDPTSAFISFFHAQNWYPELEKLKITPKSKLYHLNEKDIANIIHAGVISLKLMNKIAQENPGKRFYRLNSLSSKVREYLNLEDAIDYMSTCDRILVTLQKPFPHYLFVREWVDLSNFVEYRCFIHDNELRGISHYSQNTTIFNLDKKKVITFLKKAMSALTFYNDYVLDIAIHIHTQDMFVVEVNGPVYGYAGSANFTVTEVVGLLMRKCEGVEYPVFK